jgi:photosystem II stability/assembly factor-like uncharacterized protein
MKRASFTITACVVCLLVSQVQTGAAKPPPASPPYLLKALKARSIGPAVMGGRVSDIALDPEDSYTFYIGLGTGGVMKSSTNGTSVDAIFEKERVASVGAIAVAPSNPKHVWVGTGEANDRNSSSWGDGIYHSTDGGGSWTNTGLKKTRTIARIAAHPTDSSTVWVAAMGDLWTPGPDRGLYKTTDGGKNWRAVLAADAPYNKIVGCGDVAVDPENPSNVYAALYARQRTPWSFSSGVACTDGKDAGGIFKSTDGGVTWRKLVKGLPPKTGRIGLDIYRKNPKIVYAIVQSDEGGLSSIDDVHSKNGGVFRTEDGGESWIRMSPLNPRPFYFSQIRVDPSNDQKIYVLGYTLHLSEDGGKTFREEYFGKVHPDCHALAIDRKNPKRVLLGTDGGLYQSFNGGQTWQHLNNFAAGEYYRISLDMSSPYRIAGGLQDNLNWVGPSKTRTKDGIMNTDWTNLGGGDGFYCVFDPADSSVLYAESQTGDVFRIDLRSGQSKGIRPEPSEGQMAFRFHWNSPLIESMHEKGALYLGGNRVFKLSARGERWEAISPDLSSQERDKIMTTGSGAENYGVVYTLAESPLLPGTLWAGTDDGKLWVTRDDGAHWTDLTAHLPKAAAGQWISRIEPGSSDGNVAYLAVDAHRSGIYLPLAYRTDDGGQRWHEISSNIPEDEPVKVIREDPKNPNVLYAGTEFGLFTSIDKGQKWMKLGDLPTVAVDDIVIHPRERDLVIATHGRSLYVIDDVRPLEEMTQEVAGKEAYLFPLRPAEGYYPLPGSADWGGSSEFRGANPPEGAIITVYVKEFTGDQVKLSIANAAGQTVANLTLPGSPGLSRTSWDLKMTKDLLNDYGGEGQKFVKPGEYTVNLSYGKTKQSQKLEVRIAPGIETR